MVGHLSVSVAHVELTSLPPELPPESMRLEYRLRLGAKMEGGGTSATLPAVASVVPPPDGLARHEPHRLAVGSLGDQFVVAVMSHPGGVVVGEAQITLRDIVDDAFGCGDGLPHEASFPLTAPGRQLGPPTGHVVLQLMYELDDDDADMVRRVASKHYGRGAERRNSFSSLSPFGTPTASPAKPGEPKLREYIGRVKRSLGELLMVV